jgi:hypothetical protein
MSGRQKWSDEQDENGKPVDNTNLYTDNLKTAGEWLRLWEANREQRFKPKQLDVSKYIPKTLPKPAAPQSVHLHAVVSQPRPSPPVSVRKLLSKTHKVQPKVKSVYVENRDPYTFQLTPTVIAGIVLGILVLCILVLVFTRM